MAREVRLYLPGIVPYSDGWRWQRETAEAVRRGEAEALAVLQHAPVYTFGRRAVPEHLLLDREALAGRGAEVVESDRGGDVTFHGPGQLIAYPILDLNSRGTGAADYVRLLEETMLRAVSCFGVDAECRPGLPGVWTGAGEKLGAVGVRVQGGVSMHGLALNVETDLSWFGAIVPCGLRGVRVTSLERLLGRSPGVATVQETLIEAFRSVFHIEWHADSPVRPREVLVGR